MKSSQNKKRPIGAASKKTLAKLPVKSAASLVQSRSWAFYGRAGSGKTTLSATFPQPVLLMDIKDKGTDSISEYDIDEVAVLQVPDFDSFQEYYYYIKANPDEYGTVVIDTMSMLQQLAMEDYLIKKKGKAEDAGKWGGMTKQGYGDVASELKQWIIRFRDLTELGIEVVFLAQDRVFNAGEESDAESMLAPEVGPRLFPSVASHLNAAVNVLAHCYIREKSILKEVKGKKKEIIKQQYCLRMAPDSLYMTKARKPKGIKILDVITNPDYDKLINALNGEE